MEFSAIGVKSINGDDALAIGDDSRASGDTGADFGVDGAVSPAIRLGVSAPRSGVDGY